MNRWGISNAKPSTWVETQTFDTRLTKSALMPKWKTEQNWLRQTSDFRSHQAAYVTNNRMN